MSKKRSKRAAKLKKRASVKSSAKRRAKSKAKRQPNAKPRSELKRSHSASRKRKPRNSTTGRIPSGTEFELAFRLLRQGRSQKRSAEIAGISTKRLRRYLRGNKLAHFRNGQWRINDRRSRLIQIFTDGYSRTIKVRGFKPASLAMKHRAAVRRFLESNDEAELKLFEGASITDASRKKHFLETRPNVLYRIANIGGDADMKIYRLID